MIRYIWWCIKLFAALVCTFYLALIVFAVGAGAYSLWSNYL